MLLLFDIDDTLIPFEEFLASWHAAMRQHFPRYLTGGLTYEEQHRARMRQTVNAELSDREADDLFHVYFAEYEKGWALFPDVLPCLDRFAAYRLGVISNGNGAEQRRKLQRTGITERFELIQISGECGHAKPSAEIFHGACRIAGVQPADAIYVGDFYEADAVGSRQSGLHGVWLDRHNARTAQHESPIIGGLDELDDVLTRWRSESAASAAGSATANATRPAESR